MTTETNTNQEAQDFQRGLIAVLTNTLAMLYRIQTQGVTSTAALQAAEAHIKRTMQENTSEALEAKAKVEHKAMLARLYQDADSQLKEQMKSHITVFLNLSDKVFNKEIDKIWSGITGENEAELKARPAYGKPELTEEKVIQMLQEVSQKLRFQNHINVETESKQLKDALNTTKESITKAMHNEIATVDERLSDSERCKASIKTQKLELIHRREAEYNREILNLKNKQATYERLTIEKKELMKYLNKLAK
ncbi:hypothetical protein SOPP22_10950 [Shewanella sp. OPT22]|nr:hypothetical protein SOPP22_10950 [Shewanella sp. OPT22]